MAAAEAVTIFSQRPRMENIELGIDEDKEPITSCEATNPREEFRRVKHGNHIAIRDGVVGIVGRCGNLIVFEASR
jgi:hypothetical protein